MARLFLRLKLRLLRNSLRLGAQQAVGLVLSAIVGLPLAAGGFMLLASARSMADGGRSLAVLGFTALFLGWVTFPLLAFGSDETLDPSRLALLPLSRRQLMTGLLVASAAGVVPLATLLALTGAVVGYAPLGPGALIVVGAIAVQLALCISASRATVSALSGFLRSRRGRDLAVVLVLVVALVPQVLQQVAIRSMGTGADVDLDPVVAVVRWSPPGLAADAMARAADAPGLAVAELALAAAAVVVLLLWWARTLERSLTSVEASHRRRPQRRDADLRPGAPLIPRPLAFLLPPNRIGAVAAKELRYEAREPRHRVQLASNLALPVFLLLPLGTEGLLRRPPGVLGALVVPLASALAAINQFGSDGPAHWTNAAAGQDPRADLAGKNLALVISTMPLVALLAVALAALGGGWVFVPLTLALAVGVLGIVLGIGNVASVLAPFPLPDTTNPWGQFNGQGCAAAALGLVALAAVGVLVVPVAVLVVVGFRWPPGLALAALFGIGYGLAVWWVGLRWASNHLWWRTPELLEALSPRRT